VEVKLRSDEVVLDAFDEFAVGSIATAT